MAEPVWKRPGWITAMVGVVSVCLTIPQIVGDYLTKQQDIKLAEQKTESIRRQNLEMQQDQEFKIVSNTLSQQGSERIFVLRYLAATLDDESAKRWAQSEVQRLDKLATQKEKVKKAEEALEQKQGDLEVRIAKGSSENEQLKQEIKNLKTDLISAKATVSTQIAQVGIPVHINRHSYDKYIVIIIYDDEVESSHNVNIILGNTREQFTCGAGKRCEKNFSGTPPQNIFIQQEENIRSVYVRVPYTISKAGIVFNYRCHKDSLRAGLMCIKEL